MSAFDLVGAAPKRRKEIIVRGKNHAIRRNFDDRLCGIQCREFGRQFCAFGRQKIEHGVTKGMWKLSAGRIFNLFRCLQLWISNYFVTWG
ncbi:hypothetical protein [Azospirillum brasilense]|uniref:hypothetical protein n=1 Tax=Azospirillum brasilense TaxID=192 RepID=UPI001FFF0D1D|nr:hypothetical protein [Azospirillum brasilense]